MTYLYSWYILPNSKKISGDMPKNGISLFIQENIESIEIIEDDDVSDLYLFNKKYILEKSNIDGFFKESSKFKIQMDFIKNFTT